MVIAGIMQRQPELVFEPPLLPYSVPSPPWAGDQLVRESS